MSAMTISHVFVEGCIVPMVGGLSGPMSVYVPKAALTVQQVFDYSREHSTVRGKSEDEMTAAELQAEEDGLLRWAERVRQKKLAKLALEQVRTEQVRTEQVRAEQVRAEREQEQVRVEEVQEVDETDADDDLHMDETLEQMIARKAEEARKEKANKLSNARRERAAKQFDGLILGARLRNRQELNDGTTDYLECKKAAGRRMCEFNGRLMSLRSFTIEHRTTLKAGGKIHRDVKGDPLDTIENFRERKNKFVSLSSK